MQTYKSFSFDYPVPQIKSIGGLLQISNAAILSVTGEASLIYDEALIIGNDSHLPEKFFGKNIKIEIDAIRSGEVGGNMMDLLSIIAPDFIMQVFEACRQHALELFRTDFF